MKGRTKRKILGTIVIYAACYVVVTADSFWVVMYIPLSYLMGWLHGNMDELDEHIKTLYIHLEFLKSFGDRE